MSSKTCTVCQISKHLDEYGKRASSKDGLNAACKDCVNASARYQRAINPQPYRDAKKRYLDKVRGTKEQQERVRRWNRNSYYADVEKSRAYHRNLNAQNKDRVKLSNAKQRFKRKAVDHFVVLDKELRRLYSNPCVYCGSTENQTVDHIIPLSRGGRHSVGNLQTLCMPCNQSKHAKLFMEWKMADYRLLIN